VTGPSDQAVTPLKLAMVLFRYFPWGGMQANFLRIARACIKRGHQLHVYTLDWQGEQPEGVSVNIIQVAGRQNIVRYSHFNARIREIKNAGNYALVMGFNRMPDIDLYYAADPCFVERIRKTRPWYYPFTPRYRHFQGVEKRLFDPRSTTRILALSPLQIDEYTRNYATQLERFTLLPAGVQPEYRRQHDAPLLRDKFRSHYRIAESDWVLLMIGSGFERKGIDRGLRAVASLPTELRALCQVFVAGKGKQKPVLKLASRLGLAAQLRIVPGTDEIPLFLQGADLLMHPARSENTGNVIVESIAAGLPVLCSGTCGYATHVKEAQAGSVLNEPFVQAQINRVLADMLNIESLQQQQTSALAYASRVDLYSRTERVVEVIEKLALEQLKNA
jgi:UDP-glucose:(heptosyl)LPS alpha-1,3-glucosyltransferase